MTDRNVQYPQRYKLQKVEGTDDIYDLIPAPGTITEEGTIINKFALLKDKTAALFSGLPENPVPDDVFSILSKAALLVDGDLQLPNGNIVPQVKTEIISYNGTGTSQQGNPTSVTFSFAPDYVIALYYHDSSLDKFYKIFGGKYSSNNNCIMYASTLTETFVAELGLSIGSTAEAYGKISNAGKTFSWYSSKQPSVQLNDSRCTYYLLGIKLQGFN